MKAAADLVLWRPAVSGMGSGMSRPRRRGFGLEASRGMLPLLALQVLMEYGRAGASRPPVTAALLAANTLIYLRPGALHEVLPSLNRVAFNPHLIIQVPNLAYLSIALSEFRRWVCGSKRNEPALADNKSVPFFTAAILLYKNSSSSTQAVQSH